MSIQLFASVSAQADYSGCIMAAGTRSRQISRKRKLTTKEWLENDEVKVWEYLCSSLSHTKLGEDV